MSSKVVKAVAVKRKPNSETEKLASLLDAMIDEELGRPEEEQDIRAVGEWSELLGKITSGAYEPGRKEKQALLRSMRNRLSSTRKRNSSGRRWIARTAAAALAVLLLTGTVCAGREFDRIEKIYMQFKTRINELKEGETFTYHEENRDVLIYKGDGQVYDSPQAYADETRRAVLSPSWLPDGIEAGEITQSPYFGKNTYISLIPLTGGFEFYFVTGTDFVESYPNSVTVTVCGQKTEFRYFLDKNGDYGDAYGTGNFVYGGDSYYLKFRSLGEAEEFLASLCEVTPKG